VSSVIDNFKSKYDKAKKFAEGFFKQESSIHVLLLCTETSMGCNPENTGQKDMKSLQNKRRTAYALIGS